MVQRVIIGRLSGIFGRISGYAAGIFHPVIGSSPGSEYFATKPHSPRLGAKGVILDGEVTFSGFSV
jgi:hypothetical protein